jgi:starvation-inducible DNA-binding protein
MTAARKIKTPNIGFTVPGVPEGDALVVIGLLQDRLNALNDLALTLKHVHWNVVGRNFIGVHTMLDPHIDAVRLMVDETAERIATLGGSPVGTPGAIVTQRSWDDYTVGRADTIAHLGALDVVYTGLIEAHRDAIAKTDEPDPVTQDMLIGQAAVLEQFHWFIRAHLEDSSGTLATASAKTERAGARAGQSRTRR